MSRNTKKKKPIEKKPRFNKCSLCGKKFRTCNPKRIVCDNCSYSQRKLKKIKVTQKENEDGISYTTKCICCGQEFVTCNSTRLKCTSCMCDDLTVPSAYVMTMFEMGNEPDNSMPQELLVKCHHCTKYHTCLKQSGRKLTKCPDGTYVKCHQCQFKAKCERVGTKKATSCRTGVMVPPRRKAQ